jgi:hypothetical protein
MFHSLNILFNLPHAALSDLNIGSLAAALRLLGADDSNS